MSFATFKRLFAPPGARLFQKGGEELAELTQEAWQNHLADGPHLGSYLQHLDGTVHVSMFDIDISPRDVPREELLRQMAILKPQTLKMLEALESGGLSRQHVLVEFSGTGYHLWMFYEKPVPVDAACQIMRDACKRAGMELPFKPHNVQKPARVWLPLRINSNQHIRSVFVTDLESFDPADYPQDVDLQPLETVQLVSVKDLPS